MEDQEQKQEQAVQKLALLEYLFVFDPTQTWGHFHEFESELAKFFEQRNLEAKAIETIAGSPTRRMLLIQPIKSEAPVNPNPPKSAGKPKNVASERVKKIDG